ncbi:hypothetical protein [Microbispora rosea]|uniref:hypothetical protein n=1 Tax=Microbispora rosea TaxID=58117 RepID=UPI003D93721F
MSFDVQPPRFFEFAPYVIVGLPTLDRVQEVDDGRAMPSDGDVQRHIACAPLLKHRLALGALVLFLPLGSTQFELLLPAPQSRPLGVEGRHYSSDYSDQGGNKGCDIGCQGSSRTDETDWGRKKPIYRLRRLREEATAG